MKRKRNYRLTPAEIAEHQKRYADLIHYLSIGEFGDYRDVWMPEFFSILFGRDGQLRLQEEGKRHYNDGHYNAILYKQSESKRSKRRRWWILTDQLSGLEQFKGYPFAIVSPVTYVGRHRRLYKRTQDENGNEITDHAQIGNARFLFAFAIDLDSVGIRNFRFLQNEIKFGHYLEPTMIVTSGGGLHLYYCLDKPVAINYGNLELLNRMKHCITRCLWRYNGTNQQKNIEIHDIGQGYRFPGTKTKYDQFVRGWMKGEVPRYYSLEELHANIKMWYKARKELFARQKILSDAALKYIHNGSKNKLTKDELKQLEKDIYTPAHWSMETARRKFGEEWYEQVKEHGSVDWKKYDEQLYTSWLRRISMGVEVSVGHRYWCIYILACWAWNCKIPFSRLKEDAFALVEAFNMITDENGMHNPFTIKDCLAALSVYQERKNRGDGKPIRLSRAKTERSSGIIIDAHKRNYRSRKEHGLYRLKCVTEMYGDEWRKGNGRKRKDKEVYEWRLEHPDGSESECSKDTGMDYRTVQRWWNTTAADLEAAGSMDA